MLSTYARKKIDIRWKDIWNLLWSSIFNHKRAVDFEAEVEELWSPNQSLISFTVRTGFDLCLQACAFPAGSEIIVSAVTIPDMVRIIEHHNLVPVPVDIQSDGSVALEDVLALITPRTRSILIAHLFGNRMAFDEIALAAKKRGILIFEDCAEAFSGTSYKGCTEADVSMFSFGLIKTSTALGGGILTIRDPILLQSAKVIQLKYTQQKERTFLLRVAKYSVFKALTDSTYAYGIFLAVLHLARIDHHVLIRKLSRSFAPETLMTKIKQRPSRLLLQLLRDRIKSFDPQVLEHRRNRVESMASLLPSDSRPIGFGQKSHNYWLCPIRVGNPVGFSTALYDAGFDCADGGTSLAVVSSKGQPKPPRAEIIMRDVVYLPIDYDLGKEENRRLARVILGFLEKSRI